MATQFRMATGNTQMQIGLNAVYVSASKLKKLSFLANLPSPLHACGYTTIAKILQTSKQ